MTSLFQSVLFVATACTLGYLYFLLTQQVKRVHFTGDYHSYAGLLAPLPMLKLRQLINDLWIELLSPFHNTRQIDSKAASYHRQMLELQRENERLLRQRDQLGTLLHEFQSRQMRLLETEKAEALDQLNAGMAHELNNALNIVRGAVLPLRQSIEEMKEQTGGASAEMLTQEVDLLLRCLDESAERATNATKSVLKMITDQKAEAGDMHTLNELFAPQLQWLKMSYPDIHFNVQIQEEIHVSGDVSGLMLTVNNLLMNAIEAIDALAQPSIDLTMSASQGQLIMTVADNGPGIPESHRGKIFDPFYTTKDSEETAGLGLYSVRGLIAKMDGTVEVTDNPNRDRGTTFVVSVPVEAASPEVQITDLRVA